MAKTKDILCKVWLRRGSDGILSRRVCAGKIADHLPTEQPQISNRQADMLVRNHKGALRHIEFQATNEDDFPFRMLDYWVYFRREHKRPVRQCVFYIGREPMRLQPYFKEGRTRHRFEIVNLQDYEASELLASPDWGDNLWALGAKGERPVVLRELIAKMKAMTPDEQRSALAELTAFSGILKLDSLLEEELKEFHMQDSDINLGQNAVIRPLIEKGRKEGRKQGLKQGLTKGLTQGLHEGKMHLLLDLLGEKFGELPEWARERVRKGSAEELDRWARRVLRAGTLEDTLDNMV